MPRASKAAPAQKAVSARGKASTTRASAGRVKPSPPRRGTAAKKATPAKKRAAVPARRRAAKTTATKTTKRRVATKAAAPRTTRTTTRAAAKPAPKAAPKTATASKTRPAAPPKRRGPLDKFLIEQRALLIEEREIHTRQAESLRAEAEQLAAEMEPGDIQFDEESGEGATMNVERERDLALSAQNRAAVDEIDRALAKIELGTYGRCEQCGQPIPKPRLKALPYAALCVSCKSGGLSRR
jgi:RNA polymerase-binding transcription factor